MTILKGQGSLGLASRQSHKFLHGADSVRRQGC